MRTNNYCVYAHTNLTNGKIYIGQTCQEPKRRWQNGLGYLIKTKNKKYSQPLFANAIIKYGWDGFYHEVIASNLTKESADKFEELLIKKFDTTNPDKGYNLAKGGSNTPKSKETRKKMSENHADFCGANNPRAKKIMQYTQDGKLIKIWDYVNQIENELHIDHSNISKCCKGKIKSAGGYLWKYFDDVGY